MSKLKKHAILYFEAIRNSDLVRLKSLFADEVQLQDWNIHVHGINSVIAENAKIFEWLKDINIDVLNLYEDNSTVIAELKISAKKITPIKVVDILSFDECEMITSIRAYKG